MPLTAEQREQRDEAVLFERIQGATLRELAERWQLSLEGARLVSERAARRHVLTIIKSVWDAQRTGDVLVLALPSANEHEQQLLATCLAWFLRAVDCFLGEKVRRRVHYRPAVDGSLCFGLEDELYDAQSTSEEIATWA